jgi:uncharacterized damage-inducible protein DinB
VNPCDLAVLARYNAWANQRLYSFAQQLPAEEITRPRAAAFFGSLLGTLNHLYVGDTLWLARIQGRAAPEGWGLDYQAFDRLDELWPARQELDRRIIAVAAAQDAPGLDRILRYTTSTGAAQETRLNEVFIHLFNHQTHHRGQAHALLSDSGQTPPPLDLIFQLRELDRTDG